MTQPMQPLETDQHGIIRFRKNAIVYFLSGWANGSFFWGRA